MMRLIGIKLNDDGIWKKIIIIGSETRDVNVLRKKKSGRLKEVI